MGVVVFPRHHHTTPPRCVFCLPGVGCVEITDEGNVMSPADNVPAYMQADRNLKQLRTQHQRAENAALAERGIYLRLMVGTLRGGVAAAARNLGVSDAQIFRMLDEDLTRAVRTALDEQVVERDAYRISHQRGARSIGVVLAGAGSPSDTMVIEVLRRSGLTLTGRNMVPAERGVLRWDAAKQVTGSVREALKAAGVSPKTYKVMTRSGARTVTVSCTTSMGSLADTAISEIRGHLVAAGLDVEDSRITGKDGEWTNVLLVGTHRPEPVGSECVELVFGWADVIAQVSAGQVTEAA
jgi:hypothetical protein